MSKPAPKFVKVIRYESSLCAIEFRPVANVPGYSHMVTITRGGALLAKDWLPVGVAPSARVAACYPEKHAAALAAH